MTRLYENDRVEATQAGVERRLFVSYPIGAATLMSQSPRGIEGALSGAAVMTERPGA